MFSRDVQQAAFTHLPHLFETEKHPLSLVDFFNNDPERATRMSLEHQGHCAAVRDKNNVTEQQNTIV